MDALIAIDIALLPPRALADEAVALSASLPRTESHGLLLDAAHLPHITLTQQFVQVADLPRILAIAGPLVQARRVVPLHVTGPGRGTNSVWMQIGRTAELDELHGALMDALLPFERKSGDATAFADGDARPDDIGWVSGFRGSSSYARYTPHITLGHASRLPAVTPRKFEAGTVALCQLGRFCTCRRILESWTLLPR